MHNGLSSTMLEFSSYHFSSAGPGFFFRENWISTDDGCGAAIGDDTNMCRHGMGQLSRALATEKIDTDR